MPSGRWRVRWRDSSQKLKARSFDRKSDAEKWAVHVTRARQMGELAMIDAGQMKLGQLGLECAELRWSRKEPATANRYIRTWNNHVLPYLASQRIDRIDGKMIEVWLSQLRADGVTADGQRRALSLLRSVLARGVEWGYIRWNPSTAVPMPEADAKSAVRPLSPRQVEMIVAKLERPQDQILVRLLAYAGLRPGEALALTTEHIRKRTLLIEQANANGRIKATKTKAIRSVDLLEPLGADLREWVLASGTRGLLFPRADGNPWTATDYGNWCKRIFRPAVKAAGIEATPYTLRHSFASLLIHAGKPVTYVAQQMGHGLDMTIKTYAHVIHDLDADERSDPGKAIADAR